MWTRTLVGLLYFLLITVPTILGGIWSLSLFLLIGAVAGYEFYRMAQRGGYAPATWLGIAWLLALILSAARPALLPQTTVLTVGLLTTFIYALFHRDKPVAMALATITGAVYLGVMIGQMVALRMLPSGMWWIFFGFFATWVNDTMAYFVGVTVGRNRIWPRVSPKKTWEGTIGGVVGAALVGTIAGWLSPLPITVLLGTAIGVIAGILCFFGDLTISMVKRQVGVKDTGALFPGHGGMLDRIDSALFVLPFLYQMVMLLRLGI